MSLIKILLLLYYITINIHYVDVSIQLPEPVYKMQEEIHRLVDIDEALTWIGKTEEELIATFGKPVRKDDSAYNYSWWVYTDHESYVYQFGVTKDRIQTIYVITDNTGRETYETLNEKYNFQSEVKYKQEQSEYTIRMTTDDQMKRPVVKLNDDVFIQFYFDSFTNEMFSYRILTGNTLLTQRPYEIEYRGSLPERPQLSEKQWEQVANSMEQQIFDVTNVLRAQYHVSTVEWDESAHQTALLHSQDMAMNDYFSHTSINGDGLKERLEANEVVYMNAAENIASGYIDALSAMEGWLNSPSHREAMLNNSYTHLGVGVYQLYYTQNFIEKPVPQ